MKFLKNESIKIMSFQCMQSLAPLKNTHVVNNWDTTQMDACDQFLQRKETAVI